MPMTEEFRLHPSGYQDDPEVERFRLTTLDYLSGCTYMNFALIFKLDDSDKRKVVSVLKGGLELTLSQCKHLVGTIEKNEYGDHSVVKTRDSTVGFTVQWLDSPEDTFLSYAELEASQFVSSKLGDIRVLSVNSMTWGENSLEASPAVSAFKANFIPGGLIFNIHCHHIVNDGIGWSRFVHQLAGNCCSIMDNTRPAPDWDPACVGHTRFLAKDLPDEAKVDAPTWSGLNKDHLPSSWVLFHLPRSKAAQLKKLAKPGDGAWISTYDAFCAFLWRVLSKHRAPLYKQDLASSSRWAQFVNMRTRLNPPMPDQTQGNIWYPALSVNQPNQLTLAEIISEAPLSELAVYIRMLTNSVKEETLNPILEKAASVRDKTSIFLHIIDSFAPMSIFMTDWRDMRITETDFGFGRPKAFRHLFDVITAGLSVVYPPRITSPDSDEGCEILIPLENQLVDQVIEDPEMKKYFEFRGFEYWTGP
ncbi:acyltransferase [Xylariaceae sp. FL0662B]|nr:acyltransferase [Xylariaceae sp. FL0662B]